MRTALRISVAVIVIIAGLFAAAQLIRPERSNPTIIASHTIQAKLGANDGLVAALKRGACLDCHSNATVWSKYTTVAPMSWLIVYAVTAGRRAVNFSEWTTYEPENQRKLLAEACQDAANGKMPGSFFTTIYPEAQLSDHDVETICASAS
jgi:heme-binding protein